MIERFSSRPARPFRRLAALLSCGSLTIAASVGSNLERTLPAPPSVQSVVSSSSASTGTSEPLKSRGWRDRQVTVTLDESVGQLGPLAKDAIVNSFGTWLSSDVPLPALAFDSARGLRLSQEPDGINGVLFAPIDIPGHENDLAITLTFKNDRDEIIEADIVINSRQAFAVLPPPEVIPTSAAAQALEDGDSSSDETADHTRHGSIEPAGSCTPEFRPAVRCDDQYDLENVMAHEVGHFFGLGEDRNDRFSTMFECTSRCELHKRQLSSSDHTALSLIYSEPFAEVSVSRAGCSVVPSKPASSKQHVLVVSAFGLAFWLLRRRSLSSRVAR